MHTTPISGAAVALKATPASPANSSLADFLLAGASGNAGLDFRTIAATLFGVVDLKAEQTIEPAKDSTAAKKPSPSLPGGVSDDRKDKKLSDPTSISLTHPELTAPIIVSATAIQAPPKQGDLEAEERAKTAGTAGLDARLQSESDEIADKLAGKEDPNASAMPAEKPSPESSLLNPDQPVGAKLDLLDETTSIKNVLPTDGKLKTEDANAFPIGTSGKKVPETAKTAEIRHQAVGMAAPVKHDSASTPITKMAAPLSDTAVPAGKNDLPHPAGTDSVPVAPPVNPISDASAKEIAESHMATKAASQAKALDPALAAESRNATEHSATSELAKAKDRSSASNKDRIGKDRGKDIRTGPTDSGKLAPTHTGRAAVGAVTFGGNGSKESGLGSPNSSSALAKQGLMKQSAGISSSTTAISETDGPDEAVPVTTSSPITAKFVQGMSGSEFRVGMQSQEFGSIDIRTSVARHMFSAQISVEHSDVAKSLATELPALYSKLADQHVPVANIVIQGQSLPSSSGFAQDAQPQQTWRPQHTQGGVSSSAEAILPVTLETLDSQGRLDIRI